MKEETVSCVPKVMYHIIANSVMSVWHSHLYVNRDLSSSLRKSQIVGYLMTTESTSQFSSIDLANSWPAYLVLLACMIKLKMKNWLLLLNSACAPKNDGLFFFYPNTGLSLLGNFAGLFSVQIPCPDLAFGLLVWRSCRFMFLTHYLGNCTPVVVGAHVPIHHMNHIEKVIHWNCWRTSTQTSLKWLIWHTLM